MSSSFLGSGRRLNISSIRSVTNQPPTTFAVASTMATKPTVFALAVFLGIELISKVPTMLHTPLMSGTNAIHGIVLIGAMLIVGTADSTFEEVLGFVAVVFGTINVVGGFLVTDRMLEMFKGKKPPKTAELEAEASK